MQLFFQSFGVNWISLIWFVVLFLIVYLLLRRYAFGPILGAIDNRQRQIGESLDRAEQAARSVGENQRKAEQLLADASTQAQEVIHRSERTAADIQDQARKEAKEQADLIVTRARAEIDRERDAAVAEIRQQAVDLALLAAGKVIAENLSAERNRKLVEETIQQAELHA